MRKNNFTVTGGKIEARRLDTISLALAANYFLLLIVCYHSCYKQKHRKFSIWSCAGR